MANEKDVRTSIDSNTQAAGEVDAEAEADVLSEERIPMGNYQKVT